MATPTTNNLIRGVFDTDFEGIKTSLINFLRDHSDFPDAAYTGSAFNTLIDVLAYNTHYNMLYNSFTLNEAFLDSCSKYSSAVSLSKSLGYVPYGITAAKINIHKIITDTQAVLPANSKFRARWDKDTYVFATKEPISVLSQRSDGKFESEPFELYYGSLVEENIAIKNIRNTVDGQKHVNISIPLANRNADISTLTVSLVDPTKNNVIERWAYAPEFTSVGPEDKVFFLRLREDLFYEVFFGDGVVGKLPVSLNSAADYCQVKLQYIAVPVGVNQPEMIVPNLTSMVSGLDPTINYETEVDLLVPFVAGKDREPIESIKFNAPRSYVAQNRAVTKSDYEALVLSKFPWLESIRVWGGEDATPPRYGAVYISAKPRNRKYTSKFEKTQILNFLKNNKSMLTIEPVVVDPTYTDVLVNCVLAVDGSRIAANIVNIQEKVSLTIKEYVDKLYLTNSTLRGSELSRLIDDSITGILSNDTSLRLRQSTEILDNIAGRYQLSVDNEISDAEGSVISGRFRLNQKKFSIESGQMKMVKDSLGARWNYIESDRLGNLILKTLDDSGNIYSQLKVGSVDFASGSIITDALAISETDTNTNEWKWVFTLKNRDIKPVREMILEANSEDIDIKLSVERSPLNKKV